MLNVLILSALVGTTTMNSRVLGNNEWWKIWGIKKI